MKTIGELLKRRREQLNLSIDEVEKELRIRKKYLQALENNSINSLPAASYSKGFVRNYSRYLGLDEDKVLAIFRRQFDLEKNQKIVPSGVSKPLNQHFIKITPQIAAIIAGAVLLLGFFLYLYFQLRAAS
jgi:cytoskeletal protein RodZ